MKVNSHFTRIVRSTQRSIFPFNFNFVALRGGRRSSCRMAFDFAFGDDIDTKRTAVQPLIANPLSSGQALLIQQNMKVHRQK